MPWSDFIAMHQDVIAACDFLTTEVLTPMGLITYYVLFFIKIGSREVHIAGVAHYHEERNHQGRDNLLLFPSAEPSSFPGATLSSASSAAAGC